MGHRHDDDAAAGDGVMDPAAFCPPARQLTDTNVAIANVARMTRTEDDGLSSTAIGIFLRVCGKCGWSSVGQRHIE